MSKSPDVVAFHYIGKNGEYINGIPDRDLTVAMYARLSPINQVNVRTAAFYRAADVKPDKTETPVAPADKE